MIERGPQSPEYHRPTVGFRAGDIDANDIVHLIAIYIDEVYGEFEDKDYALHFLWMAAYQTGLVSERGGQGNWEKIANLREQGYRFGSRFSMHSKLCFRQIPKPFDVNSTPDDMIFYVEFFDNMNRESLREESTATQLRFNDRVAEYLENRSIAIPLK